jgi:hypothetical protein
MEGRGVRGAVDRRIIEVISLRHARERARWDRSAPMPIVSRPRRSPVIVGQ